MAFAGGAFDDGNFSGLGAVLCAIMIYWVLGSKRINAELNSGKKKQIGKGYDFTAKYIYVFLAVLVCILSIVYKGIG